MMVLTGERRRSTSIQFVVQELGTGRLGPSAELWPEQRGILGGICFEGAMMGGSRVARVP
jgi:hypothetical protein